MDNVLMLWQASNGRGAARNSSSTEEDGYFVREPVRPAEERQAAGLHAVYGGSLMCAGASYRHHRASSILSWAAGKLAEGHRKRTHGA